MTGPEGEPGRRLDRKVTPNMDGQGLLIFLAAAAAILVFGRAWKRPASGSAGEPATPAANASPREHALWKLNQAIELFHDNLDAEKLQRANQAYTHFYLAYIFALGRVFAEDTGAAFDEVVKTPVRMELIRLNAAEPLESSDAQLRRLLATEEGRAGLEAGRLDGKEACDASSRGPYFQRLRMWFERADAHRRTT